MTAILIMISISSLIILIAYIDYRIAVKRAKDNLKATKDYYDSIDPWKKPFNENDYK